MDDIFYVVAGLLMAMLLGVITGSIAQKKGESFLIWWMFGTLLFIVALPLVLLMDATQPGRNQGVKKCPYCGSAMSVKEMECPRCRRGQPPRRTQAAWENTVAGADDVDKWAAKEDRHEASKPS